MFGSRMGRKISNKKGQTKERVIQRRKRFSKNRGNVSKNRGELSDLWHCFDRETIQIMHSDPKIRKKEILKLNNQRWKQRVHRVQVQK